MRSRPPAPGLRPLPRRALAIASAGYVAVLAVWVDGARDPLVWLAAIAAVAIVAISSGAASASARTAGWGAAVALSSLVVRSDDRMLDVLGALGAFACVASACIALAAIRTDGGLAEARKPSAVVPVLVAGAGWWWAITARFVPRAAAGLAALPGAGAIAASAAALAGSVAWTRRVRRLELGVRDRTEAMGSVLGTLAVVAAVVAIITPTGSEAVGRLAVVVAACVVCAASSHPDAVVVRGRVRRAIVLLLVGGSVAVLGTIAAEGSGRAWTTTLVTSLAVLFVGARAGVLERPLRPAEGAWLDAFAAACDQTLRPDPDDAIRATLMALRAPAGLEAPSPELWTLHPTRVATVDAAGYLHDAEAEMPEALLLLAAGEPEATLRAELLDELEVRRADLRSLARWMSARGAMMATLVASEGEAEGLLVVPCGKRSEPPTLEEARALKRVADRIARACEQRAVRARMLDRVRLATQRAEEAEEKALFYAHQRTLDQNRDALAATRLARPATVGVYSAASRAALEALERRTAAAAAIAVVAPSGVDPVPYIARAHLSGARRDAPLVLVDATSAREHDLARWKSPDVSPLALANRGLLVLLDGAALPADVQGLVARSLAERRAPWERPDAIDVQLALTGTEPPAKLVEQGRLSAALALRLADAMVAPVDLPRLADRADDLRSIVTDRLAREGLRVVGRPVGIEHAAFARLVDHGFPGEDAELAAIVQQLVARCASAEREVVLASDVDALALGAAPFTGDKARQKDPISA
jgi:hypothetical protein